MFTAQWYAAAASQFGIAVLACIVATWCLRIPWRTAIMAALVFNSIPIMKAPGFETPFFVHDFLTPVLVVLVLSRLNGIPRGLLGLAVLAVFAWPVMGILHSIALGVSGYKWVTFLYRRLASLSFLLAGVCAFSRTNPRDVIDTYAVIWIGMAMVGMLQYFGLVDVDFMVTGVGASTSILEEAAAQRGFLGLNRGAVGSYGAVVIAFSVAHLMMSPRLGIGRTILYALGALISATVVLFAGSRTGLLACIVGVLYVGVAAARSRRHLRGSALMVLAVLGAAAVVYVLVSKTTVAGERLHVDAAHESFESRLEVQRQVLAYVLADPAAAAIGMGYDTQQFQRYLNTIWTQAHSEYLQVLWGSGFVGLALYLLLLQRLFAGMGSAADPASGEITVAVRGAFIAGAVAGLAVGNVLVVSERMATFGMAMLLVYGLMWGYAERRVMWRRVVRRQRATRRPLRPMLCGVGSDSRYVQSVGWHSDV